MAVPVLFGSVRIDGTCAGMVAFRGSGKEPESGVLGKLPGRNSARKKEQRVALGARGRYELVTTTAMAQNTGPGIGTGTVTGFIPGNVAGTGVFVFQTSANAPTYCNRSLRFAIASTNPQYTTTVAAAISAYASGAQVIAKGTGNCNVLTNAEDLITSAWERFPVDSSHWQV